MGRTVYLPIHEWLKFMVNVGKYTSPMEHLGIDFTIIWRTSFPELLGWGGLIFCMIPTEIKGGLFQVGRFDHRRERKAAKKSGQLLGCPWK